MHDNIRFFPDNNNIKHDCNHEYAQGFLLKRDSVYVLLILTVVISVFVAAVSVLTKPAAPIVEPMPTTYLLTASSGKQLCLSNVIGVSLQSDLLIFDLATGKAFFPASKFFALPLGPMPIDEGMAMCDVIMRATEKSTTPKADGPA